MFYFFNIIVFVTPVYTMMAYVGVAVFSAAWGHPF